MQPEHRIARKTVTVVASSLEPLGSGHELDPERSDLLLSRFHSHARRVLGQHGAAIERLGGDALIGVFGVPTLNEDDAVRAIRAALDLSASFGVLREEFPNELAGNSAFRMVVNTGVATVTYSKGDTSAPTVHGDVVNTASHLLRDVRSNEIVIGSLTYQLVRHIAAIEPVSPLQVRSSEAEFTAWRLLGVDPGRHRHGRMATPFVARTNELGILRMFLNRSIEENTCHLVTLIGDAGIGKTRLLEEFQREVEERATVLVGHCHSLEQDFALWPLTEIMRGAIGIRANDSVTVAEANLNALTINDRHVVDRVAQVLGLRKGSSEPADIYWALCRVLGLLAARRPLVVVVDDLHHAQSSVLDFIDFLVGWVKEVPILVVCIGRSEFLDRHRTWAGAKVDVASLLIPPLKQEDSERLVEHLLKGGTVAPELRRSIASAVAGTPFFAEELVANLREEDTLRLSQGRWVSTADLAEIRTPPRIEAVLAARLDRLESGEQSAISRAAVIGVRGTPFRASEVEAVSRSADRVGFMESLTSLVGKGLLESKTAGAQPEAGDQVLSFRHSLIRDVAYQSVSKAERARIHESFADWLEQTAAREVWAIDLDEIVGLHLRAAYRYRAELGQLDDHTHALRRRAGMHLSVAGHRALLKGAKTAVDMLANAVELLPTNDAPRRSALLDLAAARREVGKLVAATASSKEALEAAIAVGDQDHAAQAKLVHLEITSDHHFERLMESEPQEIDELIESFRQLDDDAGLARVWRLRALIQAADGQSGSAADAVQDAISLARRAGDERLEGTCVRLHCFILDWGPTPVDAVVRSCKQALDWSRDRGIRGVEDAALNIIARAAAMRGRFDEARTLLQMVRSLKLSEPFFQVANVLTAALVELLANRPERAVAILAEDEEHPPYPYPHVFVLSAQARALLEVGRTQEALHITQRCERIAPRSQRDAQIKWRQIRAVCMARQGDAAAAESYIRQAVHLVRRSEQIDSQAQVLVDLSETLFFADRADEANKSLRDALVLYERKGNLVLARRTRDALARRGGEQTSEHVT